MEIHFTSQVARDAAHAYLGDARVILVDTPANLYAPHSLRYLTGTQAQIAAAFRDGFEAGEANMAEDLSGPSPD